MVNKNNWKKDYISYLEARKSLDEADKVFKELAPIVCICLVAKIFIDLTKDLTKRFE